MKIAMCMSGQIGPFSKVLQIQKKSFLKKDWDVFVYTSNLISQKNNTNSIFKPDSKIYEYLPAGEGWRKNTTTYGIIYRISDDVVRRELSGISNQIKKSFIERESLQESLEDQNSTKWEWLKKRQLRKMYNCNRLRHLFELKNDIKYDIVVRSRFDFGPNIPIDVEKIYMKTKNNHNKLFVFGGWPCVPPMVFMDKFFCDGFVFGSPRVIDIFSSLFLKENPYPYDKKYQQTWEKFGDNVEYQLQQHLKENNIELEYIGDSRSMYHLYRG